MNDFCLTVNFAVYYQHLVQYMQPFYVHELKYLIIQVIRGDVIMTVLLYRLTENQITIFITLCHLPVRQTEIAHTGFGTLKQRQRKPTIVNHHANCINFQQLLFT